MTTRAKNKQDNPQTTFSELQAPILNEPVHLISNNVVCAISKASDQPAHTHSLIRAFARRLNFL